MSNLLKVTDTSGVVVITTFQTGQATVAANDGYEAWEVINGAFRAEITSQCRLQILSFVSAGCSGYVRVYDITNTPIVDRITSQVIVTNESPVQLKLGPNFEAIGGHIYQIQVRCEGPVSVDNQYFISNITPVDA